MVGAEQDGQVADGKSQPAVSDLAPRQAADAPVVEGVAKQQAGEVGGRMRPWGPEVLENNGVPYFAVFVDANIVWLVLVGVS